MLNRVILIGRLVRDPDCSYTTSGIHVGKLRIAVDRRTRNQETNERETDFIDIVVWQKTADFVRDYVRKGRLVSVDGRLQVRSWTAQDGSKRWATEVVAESLQALDRPREGEEIQPLAPHDDPGPTPPASSRPSGSQTTTGPAQVNGDEYDPFADP
jgi:single-strand DNA-binding protein